MYISFPFYQWRTVQKEEERWTYIYMYLVQLGIEGINHWMVYIVYCNFRIVEHAQIFDIKWFFVHLEPFPFTLKFCRELNESYVLFL